jgi:PAS domain S-box-containing protein
MSKPRKQRTKRAVRSGASPITTRPDQCERLFAAFMAHLPGPAWIKDLEGRYVLANEKTGAACQKPLPQLLGQSDESLWPAAVAAQFRESDLAVQRSRQSRQTLEEVASSASQTTYLITKFPIFNESGEVELLGGVGVDVTDWKRAEQALAASEERFRRLVDLSPNLIGVAVNGRVAFINPAGARMLGAARSADLLGRPVIEFVDPAHRAQAGENIRRLFAAGAPVQLGRETWRREDGQPIEVELSAFPFTYEGAPAIYIVAEDVTHRLRAEQQLKDYARQLQFLSQRLVETQENERRHIARELHDQVGQALTAIQISLQTASGLKRRDELKARLRESLGLLDELVRQTQDLSLSLRPAMLDDLGLEAALHWLAQLQTSRAQAHGEFWAEPLPARLDPLIETACFRVAQEALTNVVRHAQARHVAVRLYRDGEALHLVVHDDGRGFDVLAVRNCGVPGAGLGLLGMEERVALVQGRWECRSTPKHGTEIHAWFPLKWRTAAAASTPA